MPADKCKHRCPTEYPARCFLIRCFILLSNVAAVIMTQLSFVILVVKILAIGPGHGFVLPSGDMKVEVNLATINLQQTFATTNLSYNISLLQPIFATTNLCYNQSLLQQIFTTTNLCYNQFLLQLIFDTTNLCYNKPLLQPIFATTNLYYNQSVLQPIFTTTNLCYN